MSEAKYTVQREAVVSEFERDEQTVFERSVQVTFDHPDPQKVFTENIHTAR